MAQLVYATAADYRTFQGDDASDEKDAKLDAKLRRASQTIAGLILFARYAVDEDGYPTDPGIADTLRDATCAQAAWWEDTDDITGAESQSGPTRIGSVSIGGKGVSGGATAGTSAADSRYAPEAISILRTGGLVAKVAY